MGLRRRIEQRINQSLTRADQHGDRIAAAALALIDELQDGVEIELTIAGTTLPITIRLRPDEEPSK